MTTCEVCSKNPPVGVVASGLVPMSSAVCGQCLEAGAEPWAVLVYVHAMVDNDEDLDPSVSACVSNSLVRAGRTREEFDLAVKAMRDRFGSVE